MINFIVCDDEKEIVEKVKITDTIIDNQYIKNIIVINY